MYDFTFQKPQTLAEVQEILADDDEAILLAGGQTLIPTLRQRLSMPTQLVSLSGLIDLGHLSQTDDVLTIGAGVTHTRVAAEATAYPALAALAGQIGDHAVRNRGTLGGSVANNDPSACYPAAVLASDATIVTDQREINAEDFFEGMFTTSLDEGEIITAIRFPIPTRAGYAKFKQPASHFALAGVFVAQFDTGVRVAVTGVSEDGVVRWDAAEQALSQNFAVTSLDGLAFSDDDVMEDIHADAEYRAHLVSVMAKRAVDQALA